jgi:methylglutaconyl-CoA hydratase
MAQPVLIESARDTALCLTLNRPDARNALDADLVEALLAAVGRAAADPAVRAVIVTGEGACFCAGADLATLKHLRGASFEENEEDCLRLKTLFKAVVMCPKPVVAAVNGPALAGGCGLVSACDLVLAAPEASFGYPEVKIGFVAAMVLVLLTRQLGERRARQMLLTGQPLSAECAERWGLVYRIVPRENLLEEAVSLCRQLAGGAPSALALTKELLWRTSGMPAGTALDLAADANVFARYSPDVREGLDAFFGKRSPGWKPS